MSLDLNVFDVNSSDSTILDSNIEFISTIKGISKSENFITDEIIDRADCIVLFGIYLPDDDKELYSRIQKYSSAGKKVLYFHPIPREDFNRITYFQYEVGTEEGVSVLLLDRVLRSRAGESRDSADYLKSLDFGYINSETNISEEECEELEDIFKNSKNICLIVGKDLSMHDRAKNISRILGSVERDSDAKVAIFPHFADSIKCDSESERLEVVESLPEYNGSVICIVNQKSDKPLLIGSPQFAIANRINSGDNIEIAFDSAKLECKFELCSSIRGVVGVWQTRDRFAGYRFKRATIKKVAHV